MPIIYGLVDPISEQIRYVGKTVDLTKRLYMHLWYARHGEDTHKARWIRDLLSLGLKPTLAILWEGDDWQAEERRLIADLPDLTNTSAGGDGVDAPRTPEWRARIGAAHRGKVYPEDAKAALSRINKAKHDAGCKHGHAWTPENTYITAQGHRECRACHREKQRRIRASIPPKGPETHCKRGHELSGENLRLMTRTSGKEERLCRTCVRVRNGEAKKRKRDLLAKPNVAVVNV